MTADVSVVLPCAYEYEYAARTVRSVSAATPPEILREIVVVDDGSTPPLRIPEPARWKAFVVRLEKTGGLIRARIAGAAAATGAVIVFFDCHVRPMDGYWRGLLAPIEADYRVATVPTVTRLVTCPEPDNYSRPHRHASSVRSGSQRATLMLSQPRRYSFGGCILIDSRPAAQLVLA